MKKTFGLITAIAAMVGALALPAAAQLPDDAGTFVGWASVGDTHSQPDPANHPGEYCLEDGSALVSGTGLTLLGTADEAYYYIDAADAVNSVARGQGSLEMCGTLRPTNDDPQLGASCATTHGTDGRGRAAFLNGDVLQLRNLGWQATALGTFVVSADVTVGGQQRRLDALVQALDEDVIANCLEAGGATLFRVVAAYGLS